ncbi:putative transcriptional regulator, PucR family [metagenome]|uniref:Putative transcriptional regulator, PucR family n=1 Tax=metagenome TaxID=256318 RepID=A0A2P2BYX2_9ZZZZ
MTLSGAGRSDAIIELPPDIAEAMRLHLPSVADRTVAAVIAEVPSYEGALAGPMGETIRAAVQLALGGFLNLATRSRRSDAGTPLAPALDGAYRLGRGEAISGRSMEALLAAYRIGARTAWRDMADVAVGNGLSASALTSFAELVFAYIDELSAASAAGHSDELESSGRLRRRNLERLARALLSAAPADAVVAAAERADWEPPAALTAVLLPESQVRPVLTAVDPRTLNPADDLPGAPDGVAVLLVAEARLGTPTARTRLLRIVADHQAVVGPTVAWLDVATSYQRAARCHALPGVAGSTVDSDTRLADIVLAADPRALDDLRTRVLAPMASLRPAAIEKLTETLRSWLLHHGRRDEIASELFVHAQTVRYRVSQLREVYGDRLDDPAFVLDATIALGAARR